MTQSSTLNNSQPIRRRRSIAWIYYAALTVLSLFAIPATSGGSLLVTVACGLYATYLFRGGRVVIWIW